MFFSWLLVSNDSLELSKSSSKWVGSSFLTASQQFTLYWQNIFKFSQPQLSLLSLQMFGILKFLMNYNVIPNFKSNQCLAVHFQEEPTYEKVAGDSEASNLTPRIQIPCHVEYYLSWIVSLSCLNSNDRHPDTVLSGFLHYQESCWKHQKARGKIFSPVLPKG